VSGLDSSRTAIAFAANSEMFMISTGGISRSQDRGTTWELLEELRQRGNGAGIWLGGAATENEILDNVVSNNATGIQMEETGTVNNTIGGNLVGVDPTGAFAQANLEDGIRLGVGPNFVGGAAGGNVVSGNLNDGIRVYGGNTEGVVITGNIIGADAAGTVAAGNRGAGISIQGGAHATVIGGDAPSERNVISGNGYGIGMWDAGTAGNTVEGNYIGVDSGGVTALPNQWVGIFLQGGASDSIIGPNNVIANNAGGILVDGGDTLRNTITGNSIHTNADLGIDLNNGGNTELIAPLVAEVTLSTCRANGTACAGCTVEIFSDAADEGRWHEGTTTADSGGAWSFAKGSACHGPVVRATATDAAGNTSEFSPQPVAPVVGMDAEEGGIRLSWMQTEDGINRFEVYRSTSPYFTPDTGSWLDNVGPVGMGNEASYLDTTAYGEPLTAYYYIVLAVKDGEIKSPVMTRGGAFHFELEPGG